MEFENQIEKIVGLVDSAIESESNTLPSLMALKYIKEKLSLGSSVYDDLVGNIHNYPSCRAYNDNLVKNTQPIIEELDALSNSLISNAEYVYDEHLAYYFSSLAHYIRGVDVINDRVRRKQDEIDLSQCQSYLGKIKSIDFQQNDYLFGLVIEFAINGGRMGVMDVTHRWHSVESRKNHSKNCLWSPNSSIDYMQESVNFLNEIMNTAKVTKMSDLVNVPVEVQLHNMSFHSFRILTEVL